MATANPAEAGLYPFATRDAEAIPLDVIDPLGMRYYDLAATGYQSGTLPAVFELGYVWAEFGAIMELASTISGPPTSGTYYPLTIFIPPGVLLTVKFNSNLGFYRIASIGKAGKFCMQAIRKWNALALQQQLRVK